VKDRPQLRTFDYSGPYRYFLTLCTAQRVSWFADASVVDKVLSQIRECATQYQFAILAYCFMPDHLHLLVEGLADDANLTRFVKHGKQISGYAHKQRSGKLLWQPSWFDRVLRKEEATTDVIRYILLNPVRAQLVESAVNYPFLGSDVYAVSDILEDVVKGDAGTDPLRQA
jgi:putative transposase